LAYKGLPPVEATGALDTTGNNPGNYTAEIVSTTQISALTQFEMYKATLDGPIGFGVAVYVDNKEWAKLAQGWQNEWDPAQPLIMNSGQTLYFYFGASAGTSSTPISVVQAATPVITYQQATTTITLSKPTAAGNTVVVVPVLQQAGSTANTVSGITLGGSAGNFALAFGTGGAATTGRCEFWADPDCAGGQTSIVVTPALSVTGLNVSVFAFEVAAMPSTTELDGSHGSGGSSGTTFTSGATGTLAQASEIAFGAAAWYSTSASTLTGPGSPWVNSPQTQLQFTAGNWAQAICGYQLLASTSPVTYSGSSNVSNGGAWGAGVMTLEGGAAGTAGLTPVPTVTAWFRHDVAAGSYAGGM
jgi:hypothetical protein